MFVIKIDPIDVFQSSLSLTGKWVKSSQEKGTAYFSCCAGRWVSRWCFVTVRHRKKGLKGYKSNSLPRCTICDCPSLSSSEGIELNVADSLHQKFLLDTNWRSFVEDIPFWTFAPCWSILKYIWRCPQQFFLNQYMLPLNAVMHLQLPYSF